MQLLAELYLALRKKNQSFQYGAQTLTVNPNFGFFLTMQTRNYDMIPSTVKEFFRTYHIYKLETTDITLQLLRLSGFNKDTEFPQLLTYFMQLAQAQLKCSTIALKLTQIKDIIAEAAETRTFSVFEDERKLLLMSLNKYLYPQLHSSDRQLYQLLLNNIFGIGSLPVPPEPLKKTLQDYCQTKKLKLSPKILGAVLDLYEVATRNKGFVVLGTEDQHKSTAFELVKVLLAKHDQKHLVTKRCYVGAYSAQELYGLYKKDLNSTSNRQVFYPGTIPCQVRELSQEFPYIVDDATGKGYTVYSDKLLEKWLLFDGPLRTDWTQPLSPAVDQGFGGNGGNVAGAGASGTCGFFILGNNEKIKVPLNMKFVFCADNLRQMSPSEVTRLGKVFLESDYSWEEQIEKDFARIRDAHTLEDPRAETKGLEFIKKFFYGLWVSSEPELDWAFSVTKIQLVKNFFTVYERILSKFLKTFYDQDEHKSRLEVFVCHFIYISLVVGVGYLLPRSERPKFEQVILNKLFAMPITEKTGAFEKVLNPATFLLDIPSKGFSPEILDRTAVDETRSRSKFLEIRVLSSMQNWLSQTIIDVGSSKSPLLILGSRDSPVQAILDKVEDELIKSTQSQKVKVLLDISFTASTLVQRLKRSLVPKSRKALSPVSQNGCFVVVEDLHMDRGASEDSGSPIQLLRTLMREQSYLDIDLGDRMEVQDLQYICKYELGRRQEHILPKQFKRPFFVMLAQDYDEEDVKSTIFQILMNRMPEVCPGGASSSILSSLSHKATDMIYLLFTETQKTLHSKFPRWLSPRCTSKAAMFEFTSRMMAVGRCEITQEKDMLVYCMDQFLRETTTFADPPEFKTSIIEVLKSSVVKVSKNFAWDEYLPSTTNTYFSMKYKGEIEPVLCGEDQMDRFKKEVTKFLTTSKDFKKTTDLFLLDEVFVLLYRMVMRLGEPGVHILLTSPSGRGKIQLTRLAARFMGYDFGVISTSADTKLTQLESFVQQLSKLITKSLVDRCPVVCFVKLSELTDPQILRSVRGLLQATDLTGLLVERSKIKDNIIVLDYEVDEETFVRDHIKRMVKLVFSVDTRQTEAILSTEGWTGHSAEWMSTFPFLDDVAQRLHVKDWTQESFSKVSQDIFDAQEDLKMSLDERERAEKAMIEFFREAKAVSEDLRRETGQELILGPNSFVSVCEYMCRFKIKIEVEIRDNQRNVQGGINRFKALLKLSEELKDRETKLGPMIRSFDDTIAKLAERIGEITEATKHAQE